MNKIKNRINKIKRAIFTKIFVLDGLFFIGVIALLGTNFIVNTIFGLYSVALFFIGLSVYLSNTKQK